MTSTDRTDIAQRHTFAQAIARRAGERALEYWRELEHLPVELKGPQDWVSRADRDVEQLLRGEIAAAWPGDRFLGEETAAAFSGPLDRCWVIDPIDGTHNYVRGVPFWNVAVAYVEGGRAEVAATYDAAHDELYHARRGFGAWVETPQGTRRLQVAGTTSLASAFVALGHHDRSPSAANREIRRRMMDASVAMRNFGSGALQLAYVARGRFDGFIELELSIWDAIGGLLLVEEAGGYAMPFVAPTPTTKVPCLACAPGIADELMVLAGLSAR